VTKTNGLRQTRGGSKPLSTSHCWFEYYIVTTAPDDEKLQRLALSLQQKQAAKGRAISIEVWGWGTLQERINEFEDAKKALLILALAPP
jgi:cellulose synthase operon protein C